MFLKMRKWHVSLLIEIDQFIVIKFELLYMYLFYFLNKIYRLSEKVDSQLDTTEKLSC